MDMNDNTFLSQESHTEADPLALFGYQDNQIGNENPNINTVPQGITLLNDGGHLNANMDMNENTSLSAESRSEVNTLPLLGYQDNQMQNENFNIDPLLQGRNLFNDGGYQQHAVDGLASGFAYRGRSSSRGNVSTAASLSPTSKVPQSPVNSVSSTQSTMSAEHIFDNSSEDEGNLNEFQEKVTKSLKNMDDVNGQEGHAEERGNNLEIM